MNIWENAVITNKGRALLAKLIAGNTLAITRAVVGAGSVAPGVLSEQADVADIKQTLVFNAVAYPEDGKCALSCNLRNSGLETGYIAMQVGIFATDPNEGEILFFITQAATGKGTEIPSEAEMGEYSAEWTFYFKYGQADSVEVTIDPAATVTQTKMEAYVEGYIEEHVKPHMTSTSNPHKVTKAQVGLGNVDNTSDANKPVSTAQATAIADAKKAGTDAQSALSTHAGNTSNPHKVTKAQVGLGNVDNTSDTSKPVSTAQAAAIADAKASGTTAQSNLNAHTGNKENPHSVTAAQVGLGNVNNTSDASKPVSVAQAAAIADAKKAGTDAQSNLNAHAGNKENPHAVTKAQVGLGNVPNVATNDQTPTYTEATELKTLASGEKLAVSMGKIMKAITDFIAHLANKSNPHNVTASQAGAIATTAKGAAGGVASLGADGKVPTDQLPEIGGKRVTRLTVGTSASGWTAKDCDYLCDGTEDHKEINNAINALPATGGEVVLLDGTYNITGAINLNKAGVTLRGNGVATKINRAFTGSSVSPACVYLTGTDCVVRDISIEGNRETYTNASYSNGIRSTAERCTIANCYVSNTYANGIHVVADYNTIKGCHAVGNEEGIYVTGGHNVVNGNIAMTNDKGGITLNGNYNSAMSNVCRFNEEGNIQMAAANHNVVIGNDCVVEAGDEIAPTWTIRIRDYDSSYNICLNNIIGEGDIINLGTENTIGTVRDLAKADLSNASGTLGGQVVANATAAATLGTAQVRNTTISATALTAGSSALATGSSYHQYK